MPTPPPKPCFKCHKLHLEQGAYCKSCAPVKVDNRGSASSRGYGKRWRDARLRFLSMYPLCKMCMKQDKAVPADVVDHIVPHKGDERLFWDIKNWQSLCSKHHNEKTGAGL
jgi:5-methylcytosine-specific restriction protein A